MSSPKGLYKSRLFTFINRQRIRLNDRLGITIRNLQLTTEIGIKGWIFPLFQMFNQGFSVRRQLKQKIKAFLLLAPSDPAKTKSSSTKIVSPPISTTNPRRLSPVAQDNNRDVEVARKDVLIPVGVKEEEFRLSQNISIQNSLTSIPKRFGWAILNWLQTHPIIPKIKSLGHRDQIKPLGYCEEIKSLRQIEEIEPLGYCESSFPSIKSIAAPASEKPKLLISQNQEANGLKNKSFLLSLIRRLGSYNQGKLQVSTINQPTNPSLVPTNVSPSPSSSSVPSPLTIRNLFQRTIGHFFGHNQQLLFSQQPEENAASDEPRPQIIPQAPQFINLSSDSQSENLTETFQPAPIQTENLPAGGKLTNSSNSNSKLDIDLNLWEAKATDDGYVKSIADILLELLDHAIWWIEEQFRKIWQFFNNLVRQ
ncbi:hypothetical protein [Pleurocapsa sp. PCC 7319]|uniref:hypothetical protein n=1 Tax=Pleurocapsa sp. PCC 7319 TaxID=118161 RepID=UPI00034AD5C4|nr:hypothetical protein [Pleurocapsa sp. PCC 7319]